MQRPTPERPAAEQAARLARQLSAMRDPAMEVRWLERRLHDLGAATAADVLTVVLARAEQHEAPYSRLLLRVSLALAAPRNDPLRRAIASVATIREQRSLARMLGDAEAPDAPPDGEDDAGEASKRAAVPDFGHGRPLTLGERKSLARRRDRELLARVIRDPHPAVIRILLDNPAITEEDVVRLSARRPVSGAVLSEVFRHARWILRPRVRLALALNPHTPQGVALQLLPHLTRTERRQVASTSAVSEAVRAACTERSPDERIH